PASTLRRILGGASRRAPAAHLAAARVPLLAGGCPGQERRLRLAAGARLPRSLQPRGGRARGPHRARVPRRGMGRRAFGRRRAAHDSEGLRQFLSLAATLAGLAGDHDRARTLLEEVERLSPEGCAAEADAAVPKGGTIVVAFASSVNAVEPSAIKLIEEDEIL